MANAPGQAVPGTVVVGGSLASPGGPQGTTGSIGPIGNTGPVGPPGPAAATTTVSSLTVPNTGATTTVTVGDASWVTVGQMIYIANAGGSSLAGALQVTAKNGNILTLLNPGTVSAIPPADNTQSGLLNQVSGNTTDFVDGTNHCQPLAPVIWSVRSRSYSSIGNPNFEVNQRVWAIGAPVLPAVSGAFLVDRWSVVRSAGISATFTIGPSSGTIVAPGSKFMLGGQVLVIQLATQQTTLAASDYFQVLQFVEGSAFRELQQDVHSISLLVNTNAALNFSVAIRDAGLSQSLVIPVSVPSGVSLIALPNLPVWPSAFSNITSGAVGYSLAICLAAGSTFTAPATGSWTSGNFLGAPGMDNFLAKPVGTNIALAFVQHESGPQCTSLIDKPFASNLNECLRYYAKSYAYVTAAGTGVAAGEAWFNASGTTTFAFGYAPFPLPMAKSPTVTAYNSQTGAINGAQSFPNGTNVTGITVSNNERSIGYISGTLVSGQMYRFHFTADTGW
jgi:hypothetical protein